MDSIQAVNASGTKQVRLFRSRKLLIEANLMGVQETTNKRKIAQHFYYSNNDTRSPLKREQMNGNPSVPVHRRLGKRVMLRRYNNNSFQPSKSGRTNIPMERRIGQENVIRLRPNYTQQGRLTRVRDTLSYVNKQYNQTIIPAKVRLRQNARYLRNADLSPRKIHTSTPYTSQPVNYTVEVSNNDIKPALLKRHSLYAELNSVLQEEIRILQNQHIGNCGPIDAIPTLESGATNVKLDDRFSNLD